MNNYIQWPYSGLPPIGTVRTVELKNPDDIVMAHDTQCMVKIAYDGTVQTHRKPKRESLRVAFSGIDNSTFETLKTTIELYWKYISQGYKLKYVDPEGQVWMADLASSSVEGILNQRVQEGNESYAFSLLFLGDRI